MPSANSAPSLPLTPIEREIEALGEFAAHVDLSIEPNLPLVSADERALRHAFRNLLDNAARYGEGKPITVSVETTTLNRFPYVQIEISDRGPGIPPDEIDRVFNPVSRGSRAVRDQIHGTGLGLNIVKTIAEAHGGDISVRSDPARVLIFCSVCPARRI